MRRELGWAGLVAVALGVVPAAAQPAPGSDLATSVDAAARRGERQMAPAIGLRRDGSLLVWDEQPQGLAARAFDLDGAARGPARLLAANDPLPPLPFDGLLREHHQPALALQADGSFRLTWTEQTLERHLAVYSDHGHVVSSRILTATFRADGAPQGSPLQVAGGSSLPGLPAIAAVGAERWIVWEEGGGIRLRRLDAKGRPSAPLVVAAVGRRPALASAAGGVLIAWDAAAGEGPSAIRARLFKPSGKPAGAAFAVSRAATLSAVQATVAAQRGGAFLVAWQAAPAEASSESRIYGQVVAKSGKLVGAELALSASDGISNRNPRLVALARGGWAASWMTRTTVPVPALTTLAAAGIPGPTLHLEGGSAAGQDMALAADADGRVLVAWLGFDANGFLIVRARSLRPSP